MAGRRAGYGLLTARPALEREPDPIQLHLLTLQVHSGHHDCLPTCYPRQGPFVKAGAKKRTGDRNPAKGTVRVIEHR